MVNHFLYNEDSYICIYILTKDKNHVGLTIYTRLLYITFIITV
jgi:hypothetical protein